MPLGPVLGIFRKEGAEILLAVSSDILGGKKKSSNWNGQLAEITLLKYRI
jgi:hypothetical protein